MNSDLAIAIILPMAVCAGATLVAALITALMLKTKPSTELAAFWAGFAAAFQGATRWGPRCYFAPLVGAVAGALDYTSAAWDRRPASSRRAETYVRLLSSLANAADTDPRYNKRLIEAVLQANGDAIRRDQLIGYLPDDLRKFSGSTGD